MRGARAHEGAAAILLIRYLQDSASLLREYTLKALAPRHLEHHPIACDGISQGVHSTSSLPNFATLPLSSAEPQPKGEDAGELLCVVAFTRHGDRTPKQKLKFATTEPTLLAMISEFGTSPRDELKVKKIHLMEELLRRVEAILSRLEAASEREDADDGMAEVDKFIAVRQVLKAYPFTGINRKVQLKPTKWAPPAPIEAATFSTAAEAAEAARRAAPPIEAQFILKWGGELTVLGQAQATRLGAQFRSTLYPGEVCSGRCLDPLAARRLGAWALLTHSRRWVLFTGGRRAPSPCHLPARPQDLHL